MSLFVIFGAGTLAACGIVFAFFLGIASSRIEARREIELHELEAQRHDTSPA